MSEETISETTVVKSKTRTARKVLVVAAASIGLLIGAGVVLYRKPTNECEHAVSDEDTTLE